MASSDAPHICPGSLLDKEPRISPHGGSAASPATSAAGLAPWSGWTNKSERGPLVGEGHGKIDKP